MVARRFGVYRVNLDPTVGSEIRKSRPCCVVSPPEMNNHLNTVIVAPMTTGGRRYPSRIPCEFDGTPGYVALDQLRTVDRLRLVADLGDLQESEQRMVLTTLREMFAE